MQITQPVGSVLAPDDLRVGQHVAIHSFCGMRPTPSGAATERAVETASAVALGVPLQINAISLPFVMCGLLLPGGGYMGPLILDLRTVRLIAVSRAYVNSIVKFSNASDRAEKLAATAGRSAANASRRTEKSGQSTRRRS
ncbi:MAG: hypothetical protein K1X67_20870 [Fimbriimonadaceae bacterium]|nr:hypothetical protein [Fimbriimonadaceae bacterium]